MALLMKQSIEPQVKASDETRVVRWFGEQASGQVGALSFSIGTKTIKHKNTDSGEQKDKTYGTTLKFKK